MERLEMARFIRDLSPGEAACVLSSVLEAIPDITEKAYSIAVEVVCDVDADDVMFDVFFDLDSLTVDVLNGRAGSTRYGYVEAAQAAGEIFNETVDPFVDEMVRNRERGLHLVTKTHCIGIVKGLLKYIAESRSDFKEWVLCDAREYVYTVVAEWMKGNPGIEDVDEVTRIMEGSRL